MDMGERVGIKNRKNLPELYNTTFMVVICLVLNGNDIVISPKHLQALDSTVTDRKELIDFIDKCRGPKEQGIVTESMF